MTRFNNVWKIMLVVCLLCCLCLVFAACGGKDGGDNGDGTTAAPTAPSTTYTINISSVTGASLKNVSVYVYTDATMEDLVTMQTVDNNGTVTFDAPISTKYVAVLMGVPAGYQVEAYYPMGSILTDIVLEPGVIAEEKPANKIYSLGDIVYDFTITDCNGVSYKLSELLETKDAVVLNFWYLNCTPCKLEFPYLEKAYKEYADEIEVLAINCEDGNDAQLKSFAQDNELTFPMAIGDKSYWFNAAYTACPTTIVIDRYGTIVYMHTGYFDEVAPFNALFRIVTEDEYQQTLIKNVEDVITEDDYRPDGTKARPYEQGGISKFDVKTQDGELVYYNLYRLNNQVMRIVDPNAYIIMDDVRYDPDSSGVIELVLTCPDTFSPVKLAFGSTSNDKHTIHVEFVFEQGNINNPFKLALGDNDIVIKNVGGMGVYYTYTATMNGTLTITIKECTEQATATLQLYNRNTGEEVYGGEVDPETGLVSYSIYVNEGDLVQITISAGTIDSEIILPSVVIKALASFMEDGGTGVIDGKQEYTVTVLDQNGNPVPGVEINMSSNGENTNLATNEEGKIVVRLIEGAYFLEMTTPGGYVSEANSFLWSPAVKNLNVTLHTTSFHTVQLQTQYGLVLPNVQVRVYGDAALKDLMYVITSDTNGMIKFQGKTDAVFYLTLSNVDSSVQVQSNYTASGENTVITLTQTGVASEVVLGDEMPNFAVTDVDGQYHVLQDLLQEKKMVIVTFWRTDCDASIRVLNNLQLLQAQYGDEIAILALNPMDTLGMDLQLYQSMYELTFSLAKCPEALAQALGVTELPTTVVIDREGKLCLIHTGEFTEEQGTAMVEFYTTESYVHTTFLSLEELMNQNGTTEDEEELEP